MIDRARVLEGLVANAPAGLAFWDRDLRCQFVNDAFTDATGLSAGEHQGRRLSDLFPQLGAPRRAPLRTALPGGEPPPDVELAGPGEPDQRLHWLASFYAVRAPD